LENALSEIDKLTEHKRWVEARERLRELDRRYPDNSEILSELLNVAYELHDMRTYLDACERLLKLDPTNADLTLALAGAYLGNLRLASALATFRHFLQQFPQHEHAAEARQEMTELEARMSDLLRDLGVSGESGLEIAMLHERVLGLLDQGKYRQARETADELLKRYPDFPPALNNIAQAYCAEGNLAQAIATTERVLTKHPDNFHALANMVHYRAMSGNFEQARIFAERLKSVQSIVVDSWMRKAEAAAYLGDDQAILDAFHGAEQAGHLKPPLGDPLLFHLAATAHMRLGNEREARKLWQRALAIAPGFRLAKENLDDLRNSIGERHAPWFFEQGNWITPRFAQDLQAILERFARKTANEHAVREAMRQFVQQHPEIVALAPVLFDRGDAKSRELVLQIAQIVEIPELFAALRDFGLSQRGPDSLRHTALRIASEAGLLPEGSVRMWMEGKWQEVILLNYEINDEPMFQHSAQVETLLTDSTQALEARQLDRAEELLRRALAIEPNAPDLLNDMGTIYQWRGQDKDAAALWRELLDKHPDYSFPRINLALQCIKRGELEQAEALLKPLQTRKRFNINEFGYYANAQIELLMARKQPDGARTWLEMWQQVDPENPLVTDWEMRLSGRNPFQQLFRRRY
jgi:tetratricopeptide (TPR) repeat protein